MIKLFLNIRKSIKIKKHIVNLKNTATIGGNFCKSNLYGNNKSQLLNVKIVNKTKDPKKLIFGDCCNVSCKITLNQKGSINIGNYVYMNFAILRIDYNLRIGSNVLFGPGVKIWDTSNHPMSVLERHNQSIDLAKDFPLSRSYEATGESINIEDNVWIGMDVLVLGGVTIGKGAVVAARSVVTKDVKPFTMVAGVPATYIKDIPNDLL